MAGGEEDAAAVIAASATHYATGFAHAVEVFALAGGERVCGFPSSKWVTALAFTPDGRLLATASYDGVVFWQIPGPGVRDLASALGEATPVRRVGTFNPNGLAFSPDGRLLAILSPHGIDLRDAATGASAGIRLASEDYGTVMEQQSDFESRPARAQCVAFSADGRRIAVGSEEGLFVHDLDAGTMSAVPAATGRDVELVAFAADGRLLWTGIGTRELLGADVPAGAELAVMPDRRALLAVAGGTVRVVPLPG